MNKIPNYRVWHKIEKRFVDLRAIDFEKETIDYDCYGEANYYDGAKFDEIVFQQFTELYDKNKKPIYEGDRVKFSYTGNHDFYGEVIWLRYSASFGVRTVNASETFAFDDLMDPLGLHEDAMDYVQYLEVIGNIFENSELLNNELEKN